MKIFNKYLTASFKTKGAELTSLQKSGKEYIWQADPVHWNRHAPVLFPIVGKLKDDIYYYRDQAYQMGQHGFARDQKFQVMRHNDECISFVLGESAESLKKYPFRFELIIAYALEGTALKVTYQVTNPDDKEMYFSIGGHPAFNCPMQPGEKRSDYRLVFNHAEDFVTHRLTDGNFSGETETIGDGTIIPVTDSLFEKDALVFKHLRSDQVVLMGPTQKWLTFSFDGFPFLGIWSKSNESPFVCIEPWYGLADSTGYNQQLAEKEGIQILHPTETFNCSYQIEIH